MILDAVRSPVWVRNVLTGLLLLLPFVAHYASKGMAALLLAGAVLVCLNAKARLALITAPWRWRLAAFAPLLVWGLLSSLWAVEPDHSALLAFRLGVLLLAGFALLDAAGGLDDADAKRLGLVAAVSGLLLLGLVAADILTDAAVMSWIKSLNRSPGSNDYLTFINNGVAMLALLAWPVAFALMRRFGPLAATLFLAAAAFLVWRGNASTPLLGLAAGAAVFLAALLAGKLALRLAYGGLTAYLLAMPLLLKFVFLPNLESLRLNKKLWSLLHRFEIWNFGFTRFLEKPLAGWGFDSSREIPGGHGHLANFPAAELMPLHPHNSALQVWLELGAIGATLFALMLVMTGRRIESLAPDRMAAAFAAATLAGFAAQAQLSFGTWQNWWLASVALTVMVYRAGARS